MNCAVIWRENLITSIDFLRGLLTLAKEVLEEEKTSNQPLDKREQAKSCSYGVV